MSEATGVLAGGMNGEVGLLAKERTIAGPGFNRWLVPPAALAIHLCIGMAYGFSVFWLPLSRAINAKSAIACPADMSFIARIVRDDLRLEDQRAGLDVHAVLRLPRRRGRDLGRLARARGPAQGGLRRGAAAGAAAWCLGAIGVYTHQLWLMWLGSGVIGGIGLGLGYISPVSTLIKWFPDRRGMATGMAIMGFGGGAMIGAPLADILMKHFATPTSVGVWETFVAHGGALLHLHDLRRLRLPHSGDRLEAGGLDAAAAEREEHDHHAPRARERGAQDAAVLADLVGAVPERDGGHRHHRHGLADAAGSVRRPADRRRRRVQRPDLGAEGPDRGDRGGLHRTAEPVQHRRAASSGPRCPTISAAS